MRPPRPLPATPTVEELYQNSEEIYQTIFPYKQPARLSQLGSSLTAKKKKKRAAPLNELIVTEDKYLENLVMVRDKFRTPLLKSQGTLAPATLDQIFFRLDDLIT